MNYQRTLNIVGAHEAAMLVKWLMAPGRVLSAQVARQAYDVGLFRPTKGLTESGRAFAIEHMAREFERLSGMLISTQRKRFDVRCPACGWKGRRIMGPDRLHYGYCATLGCKTMVVRRRKTEPQSYECIDCGQTTGHAEDCGLSFGDEFAHREKGREA